MTEPFMTVNGLTHPCYTFYMRAVNCIKIEDAPNKMCYEEIEDFVECKSRKKHRAFHNFIGSEMHKLRIYSLPTYDPATDTFKDGPLPKDADTYFSLPAEEQNYYSDN